MPDVTVSANVDTMLRAANNAAIRSAIGVGQTDAPTFLAQTLTGQSLTGTQATSLVDLSATWNTTGTPSALKLNVTVTAAAAASRLLDLQIGGTSRMRVGIEGGVFSQNSNDTGGLFSAGSNGFKTIQFGGSLFTSNGLAAIRDPGLVVVRNTGGFCWENGTSNPATGTIELSLLSDAPGILAQRNGTNAQAFRVYDTYDTAGTNYERGTFGFPIGTNTLRIGTEQAGTGAAQPIDFVTGGVVRMSIAAGGTVSVVGTLDVPTYSVAGVSFMTHIGSAISIGHASLPLQMTGNRLAFNGTTSAFPAIKRNGTGIDIRLADDSAFAPVKGKLTTDTAYTATVVAATGYITIYDSLGQAYRVPCAV